MKPSLSRVPSVVAYSTAWWCYWIGADVGGGLSGAGRAGGGVDLLWGAADPRHWLEGLIRAHRQVMHTEEVGGFGVGCWVDRRREGDRASWGPRPTRARCPTLVAVRSLFSQLAMRL